MTEKNDETLRESPPEEVSFAELFKSCEQTLSRELQPGDMVEGRIISIGRSSVYVDTGTKSDGVVDKAELMDDRGEFPYQIDDTLTLYVVSLNESEVILSKAISGAGKAALLEDAVRNRVPVEGKVKGMIKGGFHVDILGKRAFCPVSQMDVTYVETPEAYVGQALNFVITRYEDKGRNIVVSRRDLLEQQLRETRQAFLATLAIGDTVQGTVSRLMPFGAFVALCPGLEGMAHVSELSWSRVEKAEEVVQVGDTVRVKVLKLDAGKDEDSPRISLSIKQTGGDPWDSLGDVFRPGDSVTGKVVRFTSFGAFVEIAPGVDGLVHVSEMSHTRRIIRPEEVLEKGQVVQVIVKAVDPDARRVSLSIKDALGDPWTGISVRYGIGDVVSGRLEKRENFGLFISLEPGVTGLMPASHIAGAADTKPYDSLKPGDPVSVMIQSVDEDNRRISLAPPDQKQADNWRQFAADKPARAVGTLESVFREAMARKGGPL